MTMPGLRVLGPVVILHLYPHEADGCTADSSPSPSSLTPRTLPATSSPTPTLTLEPSCCLLIRRHLLRSRSPTRPGRPNLPTATWLHPSTGSTNADRLAMAPVASKEELIRWSAMLGRGRGVQITGLDSKIPNRNKTLRMEHACGAEGLDVDMI